MFKMKRVVACALAGVMLLGVTACGAAKDTALVDETAVSRDQNDVVEGIYIDEVKVALAGSASSSAAAVNAAQAAFNLVNQQRASAGLSTLTWSDPLAVAAMVRASELPQLFSHTRPDGSDWWTVNSDIMYGENLAQYYYTADDVVAAWVASPTHNENLMEPSFRTMGIAVYESPEGKWYWAQEFGY